MYISVQYLRAIAALMVVLTHLSFKLEVYSSNFLDYFTIGNYGVDLFFIISGFIMCHSVADKNITFTGFMKARVQRIFPLYWILTLLALVIFIIKPSLVNSSGGETSLFSSFTLIPTGNKLLINNGWTLSFEFLFYFVFAICLSFSKHYRLFSSVILFIMALIGSFFSFTNPQLTFITSPLLLEFIMGIIAYKVIVGGKLKQSVSYFFLLVAIVLLILLNHYGPVENPFGRTLYAGIPMFFLFIGFVSLEGKLKSKNELFYMIGMSSYSLYLIHPFVLSGVNVVFRKVGLVEFSFFYALTMLIASVVVGLLCFYFVEKPISRWFALKNIKQVQ